MPTPLSAVALCNLALSRIGVLQQISSLTPPDNSPAGIACAAVYDFCRQSLLHEFPWGWASKYAVLTLASTPGVMANPEWLYAYQYPTDCLFVRRIISTPTPPPGLPTTLQAVPSWDRSDTNPYPPPFEIGYMNGSQVIYTDLINAACKYTFDQGDTGPMVPEFADIFAWRLAVELSMSLANNDGIRQRALREYGRTSTEGAAHAMNESQNSQPFISDSSEFVRARFRQ